MKTTIAIALFILTLFCLAGCNTFSPAEVPHDQRTAVVITPESVEVLKSAIDADTQVLASSLEQIQDEGSVIFVDHSGIVYNPDGSSQPTGLHPRPSPDTRPGLTTATLL